MEFFEEAGVPLKTERAQPGFPVLTIHSILSAVWNGKNIETLEPINHLRTEVKTEGRSVPDEGNRTWMRKGTSQPGNRCERLMEVVWEAKHVLGLPLEVLSYQFNSSQVMASLFLRGNRHK